MFRSFEQTQVKICYCIKDNWLVNSSDWVKPLFNENQGLCKHFTNYWTSVPASVGTLNDLSQRDGTTALAFPLPPNLWSSSLGDVFTTFKKTDIETEWLLENIKQSNGLYECSLSQTFGIFSYRKWKRGLCLPKKAVLQKSHNKNAWKMQMASCIWRVYGVQNYFPLLPVPGSPVQAFGTSHSTPRTPPLGDTALLLPSVGLLERA